MAFDAELADRLRTALAEEGAEEKRMFGGLAFLLGGHLAVCASGQGGLMVRVEAGQVPGLLEHPGVEPVAVGGRGTMKGWLRVRSEVLGDDADLDAWVRRGVDVARALPPKG